MASGIDAIAFGNNAISSKAFAVAIGGNSVAAGLSSLALGEGAISAFTQGVALGAGSIDGANNNTSGSIIAAGALAPVGLTYANAGNLVIGAVSVGSPGNYRQIQNIADGVAAHDAVTVQQLTGVVTATNAALVPLQSVAKLAVTYTPDKSGNATPLVDLAGNPTLPPGTKSVTLTGIAPGLLSATSLDAVNGAQLFAQGNSAASIFGGGSVFDPATGKFTAPSYSIAGAKYGDVGSAFAAVDNSISGGAGIKYFHANSKLGDSTATGTDSVAIGPLASASGKNSVALGAGSTDGGLANVVSVGAAGAERKIINLAAGSTAAGSTDAINGGQLNTAATSVASALGGGATYDSVTGKVTAPTFTIAGTGYNNAGSAFAALDSSVNGGGGIKYFHASSKLADSTASGLNSVAVGPAATATAENTLASGNGAAATGMDATALGANASAAIAGSVALGAGSTAATAPVPAAGKSTLAGANGTVDIAYNTSDKTLLGAVSVGNATSFRQIQNVADGQVATDAVNLRQLSSTTQGLIGYADGAAVKATAAANAYTDKYAVKYATDGAGNTLSEINLASQAGGPVVIHNVGTGVAANDAVNVGQLKVVASVASNSVQYDKNTSGTRSNTLTLTGGNAFAPVTIQNVAAGVRPTDAANVGQLNNLQAYTTKQIARLDTKIDAARVSASSGTALALAATGLRYGDVQGKTSIAGATAVYKGRVGMAFGVGHTSEDGRWRYNVAASFAPQSISKDFGVVAGASYTFD